MGTLIRRTLAAVSLFFWMFVLFPGHAAAQTDGWVGFHHEPTPPPQASGECGTIMVYADVVPPEGGYGGPTFSNLTWSWCAKGATGLSISGDQNATLKAKVSPPGNYSITVKATATWDVSTGGTVSADAETTFNLPVVGVGKLQIRKDKYTFTDLSGTLYVLVGQSLEFQAVPTPDDATFPDGALTWSGSSGAKSSSVDVQHGVGDSNGLQDRYGELWRLFQNSERDRLRPDTGYDAARQLQWPRFGLLRRV